LTNQISSMTLLAGERSPDPDRTDRRPPQRLFRTSPLSATGPVGRSDERAEPDNVLPDCQELSCPTRSTFPGHAAERPFA
jgi:hypothetical protein